MYWLTSYNQTCLLAPTICSIHQSEMSDFRDIVEFRASPADWFESMSAGHPHLQARGRNFKLQLQTFFPKSNLCETPIEVSKVAGGRSGWKFGHFKTNCIIYNTSKSSGRLLLRYQKASICYF